jgi:hypothetical protein
MFATKASNPEVLNNLKISLLDFSRESDMVDISTKFFYQGIIVNRLNNEIPGYPVAKEVKNISQFQQIIYDKFNYRENFQFFVRPYLEGFVVRLYCVDNFWIMSTNKCIDAFSSTYNSDLTFGDIFIEILKSNFNIQSMNEFISNYQLKKSNCYFFIVGHPSIYKTIDKSYIYQLYSTKYIDNVLTEGENINDFPHIQSLVYPSINQHIIDTENKGLVIEGMNERYVWFSPKYTLQRIINSHKNKLSLLLELNENQDLKQLYCQLYPESIELFQEIEGVKMLFCKEAHSLYVIRHIRKNFIQTNNKTLHYFVSDKSNDNNLFANYIKNRQNMYIDDIVHIYNTYSRESKFLFLRPYISSKSILLNSN